MENTLYYLAVALVVIWAICFLGFQVGDPIHIFLFMAAIAVLLRLTQEKRHFKN